MSEETKQPVEETPENQTAAEEPQAAESEEKVEKKSKKKKEKHLLEGGHECRGNRWAIHVVYMRAAREWIYHAKRTLVGVRQGEY